MRWWRRGQSGGSPRDPDWAVRQALLAVLDRDWVRAEQLLEGAVRLDSEAVDAYLALGRVYRQRGEIGRAIRIHQNLLLRPDLGERERLTAVEELAADFRQGGFLRRAIASYEEVLARDPRDAEALRALVRLYADVREHGRALELERRLAKLENRDGSEQEAELLVAMAETAQAEGRNAEARKALRKALRRNDRSVAAWIALGDLEAERGKDGRALDAWRKVPKLDRRSGQRVYPRLESAFAAANQPRAFEAYLRELLEDTPDDAPARLALARHLAARGDTDAAVAEVRRVLERHPESLEAHGSLGRILLAEHRDPDAIKEYAEFLEVLDRQGLLRSPETTR